jgi:hypothetical protein
MGDTSHGDNRCQPRMVLLRNVVRSLQQLSAAKARLVQRHEQIPVLCGILAVLGAMRRAELPILLPGRGGLFMLQSVGGQHQVDAAGRNAVEQHQV